MGFRGSRRESPGPVTDGIRPTPESGPLIYPGMEDAGIGSVIDEDPDYSGGFDPDGSDEGGFSGGAGHRADPDDIYGGPDGGEPYDDPDDEADGPDGDEERDRRRLRRINGPYRFIALAFIILFIMLMANLIRFNIYEKDAILNNPNNRRQNAQAERVVRGPIVSSDGVVLARTEVYGDGTEERVYPGYNVFAHVVGYTSRGKTGLESIANYQLLTAHNNIIDQIINDFRNKKNPGDTVVTTIDASLQQRCYEALGDRRGAVVAIDPRTGAVRAMVSKPDFDPNSIADIWDEMISDPSNSQLLNRATQGLYPPGSTFKIVTSLSYLRAYNAFDSFRYNCTGEFTVDDSTVHCYNNTAHGEETFSEAFAHSCNTAFSEIGLMLGTSKLSDTAKELMFGEKMPSELYSSRTRWQLNSSSDDIELVQTAFGQGKTLTTPYHMALIAAAIANRGVVMTPYLIERVENSGGSVISRTSSSRYRRIMSESEAARLTQLMETAVTDGTASLLSDYGISAAGKTGSAEYYRENGSMGTHSWFVGFTNPGNPDLVIAVLAEDGGAGSSTAVPIAAEILDGFIYD